MADISLELRAPVLAGNARIGNVTEIFGPTWRRSICAIGGYKIGTVNLTTNELTPAEMREFFRYGLMREICERRASRLTWQGFVSRMEWTHQGDVFSIDMASVYNTRRALYRRLYDNLLMNGSAESGAWTAYNGATVEQSTTWVADGSYSCKITVSDSVQRGATIQEDIAILGEIAYTFTARLHVDSGSWTIAARRSDTDDLLKNFKTSGAAGDVVASFTIDATNTYEGNIYIIVRTSAGSGPGVCYVDSAVFKVADQPADTAWYVDAKSLAVFGRREWIDLWGGLSYEASNARVQTALIESAWPLPDVPANGSTRQIAIDPDEDKLTIVFSGYWATLNWLYTRLVGSGQASDLVTTLVGYQSDYVTAGVIAANTLQYLIEDSSPLRVGDVLKEIADSGDDSGQKYAIGVYANRKLNYAVVPEALSYHLRGGRLLWPGGGDVEPWLAQPGWAQVDELPAGPGPISGHARNDARWRYLAEIEMMPPDNTHPNYWLSYSREATG